MHIKLFQAGYFLKRHIQNQVPHQQQEHRNVRHVPGFWCQPLEMTTFHKSEHIVVYNNICNSIVIVQK